MYTINYQEHYTINTNQLFIFLINLLFFFVEGRWYLLFYAKSDLGHTFSLCALVIYELSQSVCIELLQLLNI